MEYFISIFRKKVPKKEVTLEDLQDILFRTSSPPKKNIVAACDYNEVYPKIYIGDM